MELYHNQVTRVQGPFSLRMFHRSWGLMLIQVNIAAPCALLDFPSLERFTEEIRENHYDVIGISSIAPNLLKVRKLVPLQPFGEPSLPTANLAGFTPAGKRDARAVHRRGLRQPASTVP